MPKIPITTEPTYIGVDPGQSGGIALICDGIVIGAHPMPTTETDLWNLVLDIQMATYRPRAIIEKVRSSPQMGVTSAFTFGRGFGSLVMALVAAGIPFEEVTPQTWQKSLAIPIRKKGDRGESKGDFKERLRSICQKIHPQITLWKEPKSKGRQLAVCDAMLMATYLYRKNEGKL